VQMWLGSFYKPGREITTTYSVSPFFRESIRFGSRTEQIFERYLYAPAVKHVLEGSRKVKLIQTGSIHAYLAYIFVTLVILFMFVILGGR